MEKHPLTEWPTYTDVKRLEQGSPVHSVRSPGVLWDGDMKGGANLLDPGTKLASSSRLSLFLFFMKGLSPGKFMS